ncbi:MAG: hypothetical protein ISR65_16910 [Bacteriovoracaceae bacterium]|nr:hypothetical protein [Bacteriovoracaceae bacterium]
MDTLNIENFSTDRHEPQKKCLKCKSLIINKSRCEVCGIQFEFDKLGDPLGERSFFTKKNDYWDNQSKIIRNYPILEWKQSTKVKKYKRSMFNRLEILVEYFINPYNLTGDRYNENARTLYFYELNSIIKEMIAYDIKGYTLLEMIHNKEIPDGVSLSLAQIIKEKEQAYLQNKVTLYHFMFRYYIAGAIRPAILLITIAISIIVVTLSLAYYRYLLLLS